MDDTINLQEILDELDSKTFQEDEYGDLITISKDRLRSIVSTGEDYRKRLYATNVIGLAKFVRGDCVGIIGMNRQFHVDAANVMDHQANIITELGIRAEAAEEKLAELEKQEPVGYPYNRGINCEIVVADLNYDCPCGVDLFARPAPAVSLAELVPEDTKRMDWLVSMCVEVREPLRYGSAPVFHAVAVTDEEDDYHATTLREQIDAILRNIEEAK